VSRQGRRSCLGGGARRTRRAMATSRGAVRAALVVMYQDPAPSVLRTAVGLLAPDAGSSIPDSTWTAGSLPGARPAPRARGATPACQRHLEPPGSTSDNPLMSAVEDGCTPEGQRPGQAIDGRSDVTVISNRSSGGALSARHRVMCSSIASQMRAGPLCRTIQRPPSFHSTAHAPASTSSSTCSVRPSRVRMTR